MRGFVSATDPGEAGPSELKSASRSLDAGEHIVVSRLWVQVADASSASPNGDVVPDGGQSHGGKIWSDTAGRNNVAAHAPMARNGHCIQRCPR